MHAVSLLVSLACLEMAIAFAVQKSLWSTSGTECSVCSFAGADKHRMFSVAAQRTRSQMIRMDDAMGTDVWTMRDSRLAVQGKDVWVSDGLAGPKAARGEKLFQAGGFVQWAVLVQKLSDSLCIGLTSANVPVDAQWTDDQYFGEAFFITKTGKLCNGPQIIYDSQMAITQGDLVSLVWEGEMLFISINGQQLPASLGPITKAMYPSVQLSAINDSVSLEEQPEQKAGISKKQASQESTTAMVSALFANAQKQVHQQQESQKWTSSWDKQPARAGPGGPASIRVQNAVVDYRGAQFPAVPVGLTLDATQALSPDASAPAIAGGGWEMVVAESGKVYYWNIKTDEVSWQRPADYIPKTLR